MEITMKPEFSRIDRQARELTALVTLAAPDLSAFDDPSVVRSSSGLDVVAVIDKSGSMEQDAKLDSVKAALRFVIGKLGARDRVALVAFNADGERVGGAGLRSMTAEAKSDMARQLDGVSAGGDTRLMAGLGLALDTLRARRQRNAAAAVLLMTDGRDTCEALAGDAEERAVVRLGEERDCALYAFGFGTDHDARLLARLAQAGRGMFAYVPSSAEVAAAVGGCMGGLLSAFARDVCVDVSPLSDAAVKDVMTEYEVIRCLTPPPPSRVRIRVPDMFCGERRDFPVVLGVPACDGDAAASPLAMVRVAYASCVTGREQPAAIGFVTVDRAEAAAEEDEDEGDRDVDAQRNRALCARAMRRAAELARAGRNAESVSALESADAVLDLSQTGGTPECAALAADLKRAMDLVSSPEAFSEGGGEQALSQSQMSHSRQRASTTSDSAYVTSSQMEEAEEASASALADQGWMRKKKKKT